ncbi:SDR family NAD(P)-dependent oxidoreductase [Variovorax arabinosiphilus]|uniref:SDR family NAD(P)-dependent oxidoreductase n=1 Tax=Variovorax arabinosiphilus TaxID=3053498 RepID=UPI002576FF0A|nr:MULTISPECIES: SDR family NAD(P)-dependent oxidoreductase [unclassified Variovorax]MDM0119247.1 SDR family NAD(P)-dependent oxidoreductase [Variovorax sp. J2L1-78]MDM0129673.1 SDR family NAD(P)-dependent oxidoreductase [Variovorax sp. J2L1-63]MDM0232541.1 SDR family NAD(P)-dependent oxidoreductase [Variovorax sp. J2R1-6]
MNTFSTIVLTGATNGLGRIAASALARPGVRLVLVARNRAKAEATRAALLQEAPGAAVDCILADFANLRSVAQAGARMAAEYPQIDVLINNAGIHAFEQRVTPDGFSEMVSTNYLAPWLLTACLRRSLVAAGASRVVTVGSEASRRADGLDIAHDLTDTRPFSRLGSSVMYGKTKLMAIMFSAELARRLASTAVVANSVDPGFNVTGLGRELPFAATLERVLRALRVGAPERGAAIIARLATSEAFAGVSGGYFSREAQRLEPVQPGGDELEQRRLWIATERWLAPFHRRAPQGA